MATLEREKEKEVNDQAIPMTPNAGMDRNAGTRTRHAVSSTSSPERKSIDHKNSPENAITSSSK